MKGRLQKTTEGFVQQANIRITLFEDVYALRIYSFYALAAKIASTPEFLIIYPLKII